MQAREGRGYRDPLPGRPWLPRRLAALGLAVLLVPVGAIVAYNRCKIEVQTGEQVVLIRKVGLDLAPDMELAPAPRNGRYYKGIQPGVLTEGRYFYNPFYWDWEIKPQFEVKAGEIGVRIALAGEDLPAGQVLADREGQKGIRRGVLEPGRYAYNWYAEQIELHTPVAIPPGSRGVVTLLAGREPKDPNVVLVGAGERGVQKETLPPGTHYLNPYEARVSVVDCRNHRFHLGQQDDRMSFLSSDGFEVVLDGTVEFRVHEADVARVFVLYNEDQNGDAVDEEIVAKIITPESRSICRINGSKLRGRNFFGEAQKEFQADLVKSLSANCKEQGIEIVSVSIASIQPPQEIAAPVRAREIAKQELARYLQERDQQESEKQYRVEKVLVEQTKKVVEGEKLAAIQATKARQQQKVAVTLAEQKLEVAKTRLEAAKDEAAAQIDKAKAEAEVIRLTNKAEVAGLAAQVQAFDGDGAALAQNLLIGKLAPAFRTILSNADGPLMDLFDQMARTGPGRRSPPPSPSLSSASPGSVPKAELPKDPFTAAEPRP